MKLTSTTDSCEGWYTGLLTFDRDREPDPPRPPSRSSLSDELSASLSRPDGVASLSGVVSLRFETLGDLDALPCCSRFSELVCNWKRAAHIFA